MARIGEVAKFNYTGFSVKMSIKPWRPEQQTGDRIIHMATRKRAERQQSTEQSPEAKVMTRMDGPARGSPWQRCACAPAEVRFHCHTGPVFS